ncbi:uncharacterized protein [Anabrus simplex]|uniref:uncharacterized protein n=1 Tax=Anabrus simplex TaxID=316456 RepID=UPI0035A3086B
MPQHILPKSLFKLTLRNVEILVKRSCVNIELKYGNYDSEDCRQAIYHLQQYLLSNIPGMVLDEVCEERRYNETHEFPSKFRDVRILLALYMHNNMRVFNIGDSRLSVDDQFWMMNISRLHNLVVLDLHLTCTDEILEVVGKTCSKLEQINIVSRLEPERVVLKGDTFNALKLRFFISDVGLRHLSQCKLLKKVTMNKMLRSQFGGRMMTDDGIRYLIKSLPCIEFVSYDDMGMVIDSGMEDIDFLPLTYLSDHHPNARHIQVASRLCKNLHHLCLHIPNQEGDRFANVPDILNALAESDLRLSDLELLHFPCSKELFNFLRKKGCHLKSLYLQTPDLLCANTLRVIGETCPGLQALKLLDTCYGTVQLSETLERQNSYTTEALFCNLRYCWLADMMCKPDVILPMCLKHAKLLETLTLVVFSDCMCLDDAIAQITSINPLTELKTASFFRGCCLSFGTVQYFLNHCPKLSFLTFPKCPDMTHKDIIKIYGDIKQNNFDLHVEVQEPGEPVP